MPFEWDPVKDASTRAQRGFGFAFAALIFEGPTMEAADVRDDYGETRFRAIGMAGHLLLCVVYTDRGSIRRIISARRANRKERQLWQSSG